MHTPHLTGMTLPYLDPKKERIAAASNTLLFAGHVGYHELRRRQDILMEGMLALLVGLSFETHQPTLNMG